MIKNESRLTFFDLIKVINKKTKVEWTEEVESAFEPFMINRNFSMFPETCLIANELNKFPDLDKKLQFDFYFNALPKKDRFAKWDKAEKLQLKEKLVMEYHGVSREKAKSYIETLDVVNPNWDVEYSEKLNKGGKKK